MLCLKIGPLHTTQKPGNGTASPQHSYYCCAHLTDLRDQLIALHLCNDLSIAQQSTKSTCPVVLSGVALVPHAQTAATYVLPTYVSPQL